MRRTALRNCFLVSLLLVLTVDENSASATGTFEDFSVRLVNPKSSFSETTTPTEGRLEIFYDNVWGSVCDDYFTSNGAKVACASLGFGYIGEYIGNRYPAAQGKIWLDDVKCTGLEHSIHKCKHQMWGKHNCGHHEDVSIRCGATGNDAVRLVNSLSTVNNPMEGRLEIQHSGIWGTVCNSRFTSTSAAVVCASLGFGYVGSVVGNRHGNGTGQIWLDEVDCNGNEASIDKCEHGPWGLHTCDHRTDVSISCGATPRLINSLSTDDNCDEGRLEIYYAGVWSTICSDGFENVAAGVACAGLGYGHVGAFIGDRHDPGTGPIAMNEVRCNGTETSLGRCPHQSHPVCSHEKDVLVRCGRTKDLAVRLVNLQSYDTAPMEGRLEIYYAGVWGAVCAAGFTNASARVACASLGFGYIGAVIGSRHGNGTSQIWLDSVNCSGNELTIDQCVRSSLGSYRCTKEATVSISCGAKPRLVNELSATNNPKEGRLEIYYAGVWGSVCGNGFSHTSARVACASLGYGYIGAFIGSRHGNGTGQIWLDDVSCNGTERGIEKCEHSPWGSQNCSLTKAVSISCGATPRLVNSLSSVFHPREGRLEVYYAGRWGPVCDAGFTGLNARVACNSLGFGRLGASVIGNRHGNGSGEFWLDGVECKGIEQSIDKCAHNQWGVHSCTSDKAVSIRCGETQDFQLRLVNSFSYDPKPKEGRLEIYYSGIWGSICDDGFTSVGASVACAKLGFGHNGTFIGNRHTGGYGQIWLDDVRCNGTELNINECEHGSWGLHNCEHGEDVSISCVNDTVTAEDFSFQVRLVNTLSPNENATEGRVEIRYFGVWGTVCSSGFSNISAGVACASLGLGNIGTFIGNRHGAGSGRIWLDAVVCGGSEESLDKCAHRPWGLHGCVHAQDVSIRCGYEPGDFDPRFRLVNTLDPSGSTMEGRLEVYYARVWGSVCNDGFSDTNAGVTCASLGFGNKGVTVGNRHGSGTGKIWLDDVSCNGTEQSLNECRHRPWGSHDCNHNKDVAISCGDFKIEYRLMNTLYSSVERLTAGRLEVLYAGVWGSVCDDGFTHDSARVACASLGFGYIGSLVANRHGNGEGQIWLDDVNCVGTEQSIDECAHNSWGVHNCGHAEDVSISCGNTTDTAEDEGKEDASGEVSPDTDITDKTDEFLLITSTTLSSKIRESTEISVMSFIETSEMSIATVEDLTLHHDSTSAESSTLSSSTSDLDSFAGTTLPSSTSILGSSQEQTVSSGIFALESSTEPTVSSSTFTLESSVEPTVSSSIPASESSADLTVSSSTSTSESFTEPTVSFNIPALESSADLTVSSSTSSLESSAESTWSSSSSESSLPSGTSEVSSGASDLPLDPSVVSISVSTVSSSTSTDTHTITIDATIDSAQSFDISTEETSQIDRETSTVASTVPISSAMPSTETPLPLVDKPTSEMPRYSANASNTEEHAGHAKVTSQSTTNVVMFSLLGFFVVVLVVGALTLYIYLKRRRSTTFPKSEVVIEYGDQTKTDDMEMDANDGYIVPLDTGKADISTLEDSTSEPTDTKFGLVTFGYMPEA